MNDACVPKPGVVLGYYPQRQIVQPGWVERSVHGLSGDIRRSFKGRRSILDRFVSRVNRAESGFVGLTDDELRKTLPDLRYQLVRDGFSEAAVAPCFALIREVSRRIMGMRHFDVQIMGGWLMLSGLVAEMQTGEGKTLTATLTAGTAALAGAPVHVITVNDYLVVRDAEVMRPLYQALGLTVGTITEDLDADARRLAYSCDITYCTSKQLVFDYLKDRLAIGRQLSRLQFQMKRLQAVPEQKNTVLLRGLCFAIVDEADSILIDEARTPLIISQEKPALEEQLVYQQALEIANRLQSGRDFRVIARSHLVELTELGKAMVMQSTEALGGIWSGKHRGLELVGLALSAIHLYTCDKHYLLRDGKVQIIDEFTGRIMADRSWERGLHQLIETKEDCAITNIRETLARISYQQFFRRYLRLGGMTGTAHEVAGELWAVYSLNVAPVPTNRPVRRRALPTRIFPSAAKKWAAIVARIAEIHAQDRPILVGTRSVAASEHLSGLLREKGIPHLILNARQDEHEAEIIATAGERGRVVVATNMAGRGTDIKLQPGVPELGGLHVIATEMHESGRIDRQLFGRCGRQGDPGSHEMIVSLEDELLKVYGGRFAKAWLHRIGSGQLDRISQQLAQRFMQSAQKTAEKAHSRIRRNMLKIDEQIKNSLAFSGTME